ncbi:protein cdv3 isoform b, partial [Lynx pardinus]
SHDSIKDEDEWKEFEQKEVDYSGLRVQAMPISEKEEDNEKREDPGDNWEEGGGGDGGIEESSGPWSKTAPVQAPPAAIIITETSDDQWCVYAAWSQVNHNEENTARPTRNLQCHTVPGPCSPLPSM